jgi:uncharacterized membrane protein YfcA
VLRDDVETTLSLQILMTDVFSPEVSVWAIGCVFVSYFLGFFVRGTFGFGSNIPIVLLTTPILGPHHAIVLVAVAAFISQIDLLPQGLRTADWQVSKPLIVGMIAGSAVGTWLLTLWKPEWLTVTMGLLIIAVVGMDRFRLLERVSTWLDLRSRVVTSALAVTAGSVGTVSGGGALYFLVAYLKLACQTPESFRGTNLILSGIFMTGRMLFFMIAGLVTLNIIVEALVLVPAIFLGTWVGTRFFHAASPERFWTALQGLLVCGALVLVGKGFAKMR